MFVMLSRINQRVEIAFLHEGVLNSYDPDRYIEANYGRFLEKVPDIQPERADNRNIYFAEDEEIDDEPEEESRKQNTWDMYYGLGH